MTSRLRNKRPMCAGTLRDGATPCNNSAKPDSTLCGKCQYREENGDDLDEPVPVTWDESDERGEGITPEKFRDQLAEDLADDYPLAVTALRDAMQHSTRRGKAQCPKCKTRIPVDIPDHGARVKAVQTWTELGFGRIREHTVNDEAARGTHPHNYTRADLQAMTDKELENVLAGEDPRETTAEQLLAAAKQNADGTVTVPAAEWTAFRAARLEWDTFVGARAK